VSLASSRSPLWSDVGPRAKARFSALEAVQAWVFSYLWLPHQRMPCSHPVRLACSTASPGKWATHSLFAVYRLPSLARSSAARSTDGCSARVKSSEQGWLVRATRRCDLNRMLDEPASRAATLGVHGKHSIASEFHRLKPGRRRRTWRGANRKTTIGEGIAAHLRQPLPFVLVRPHHPFRNCPAA
jgi:hypothetical protein